MRSLITAIIVFFLIIIIIITGTICTNKSVDRLNLYTKDIINYTKQDDFNNAISLLNETDDYFNKLKNILGMIFDHTELEKIETSFRRSREYLKNSDKSNGMAELTELQWLINHLPESQKCNFENLF